MTPSDFELNWAVSHIAKDSLRLSANVSEQEIHKAMFSLKPYKAPGMDRLHARFFQHFWNVLGQSIIEAILAVFHSKRIPNYLNQTLVVVIPKREGPKTLSYFRPISLCSTIYKVISKITVNRIRPHMHHLISPLQAAFIPGRKGLDNIIAQEVLHTMEKTKRRTRTMALKIDLEKAFDRLEWSFIHEVLVHFNFPKNIIDIIMACISSTSVSILFNGGKLEPFTPTQGICQGDPLSPYIFILCLEYLGLLILDKIADNTWKPVKDFRSGPSFPHLFFEDDLILFGQATRKNAQAIEEALSAFCALFGQKVSKDKSRILFSKNTSAENCKLVCHSLGILETNKFDQYLGFPLKFAGQGTRDFNFLFIEFNKSSQVGKQASFPLQEDRYLFNLHQTPYRIM